MSWKEIIKNCLSLASAPIRRNANFFVSMYILGMVSSLITIPKNGTLYENMFLEQFLDLYIVSAILAVFPKKVRRGLRAILYIILYVTAAADTYCFVNFGSTLNPSMLMLVGETNSSEASSFLSALISVEVLFSSVGWILLLALLQILIVIFRKRLIKIYVFLVTVLELASLKKRLMAIPRMTAAMPATFGILCLAILITSICTSWHNKEAYHKLMSGRTIGEVEHTMQEVLSLDPDSITVHSLAIKRAARLNLFKDEYKEMTFTNNQRIMEMTEQYAAKAGMFPYYLYRQKNMKGNFENVGYAKPEKEGIYNILIMEEKQSILALGAGASTKFVMNDRIERAENVKDIKNYIERIDEMIERKKQGYCDYEKNRV